MVNVAECLRKFVEKEGDNPRTRIFCSTAKDLEKTGAHNYESGGRGFESLRARQLAHCWHDCFVPCVGKLLPRRARRGSAVEAGTVLLLPSIRIERLMAVGGIGWGQAVSGLYARRRRDWQPPQTGPATSIACIAVRVTRPPPRFCQPISRCDWSMASHAALRVRDPWPSNKPNTQAKPTVADGPK